ncbi:MAG: DUF305 domain-containing protein [Acidimicrobiia bacterium]|nr:DUF305 domain-containing protein [Acidimicrobiia bacterium]
MGANVVDERAADDAGEDDVVVLSWWQHPVNVIALAVTSALVAEMIGWLLASVAAEPGGGDGRHGVLQDMRVHHEQAVQMGSIFLDRADTDPGLHDVARGIVFGQGIEIGRMIQLLRDLDAPEAAEGDVAMAWMGMTTTHAEMAGMTTEAELDELVAASGADADERFVRLMIAHHRGAVTMAEFAADRAGSAEVRAMAAGMATRQADEIAELEQLVG